MFNCKQMCDNTKPRPAFFPPGKFSVIFGAREYLKECCECLSFNTRSDYYVRKESGELLSSHLMYLSLDHNFLSQSSGIFILTLFYIVVIIITYKR